VTPAPRANALTVDVEEWFHICGVDGPLAAPNWDALPSRVVRTTQLLLDDLDRAGVRATFFILGWVADRYPALVQQIHAAGHEIGTHGYGHVRVYELGADDFVADLRRSIAALHSAGVDRIVAFRAPEWSINDRSMWALDLLAREGIQIDASMAPLKIVGRIDYPRTPHVRETSAGPLVECPPLVADRFGHVMPMGWGWGLRYSSPRRVLRTMEAANRQGQPAVLMVHPWEVDPDPPRVSLPPKAWFSHYFRLGGFRRRLIEILASAELGAVSDLTALSTFL
jgi:polysaccharide deacetylase family protein (PEP-CTERM system associated)